MEVFDSHVSIFFVICLNHFYILQASFFDPLGKLTALLGKLMENPRLLLENLFSMYVGHGSGWAGGVTRSVKNCCDDGGEDDNSNDGDYFGGYDSNRTLRVNHSQTK